MHFLFRIGYNIDIPVLEWSEWGECEKNRSRPDISCLASSSSESCSPEVEREECSSPDTSSPGCNKKSVQFEVHQLVNKIIHKLLFLWQSDPDLISFQAKPYQITSLTLPSPSPKDCPTSPAASQTTPSRWRPVAREPAAQGNVQH